MSWATHIVARLQAGETVAFKAPNGNSMRPRIDPGDPCVVEPVRGEVAVGEVVVCRVKGNHYLHLVKARKGDRYQIGNNRNGINGWVGIEAIYGRLTSVRG